MKSVTVTYLSLQVRKATVADTMADGVEVGVKVGVGVGVKLGDGLGVGVKVDVGAVVGVDVDVERGTTRIVILCSVTPQLPVTLTLAVSRLGSSGAVYKVDDEAGDESLPFSVFH